LLIGEITGGAFSVENENSILSVKNIAMLLIATVAVVAVVHICIVAITSPKK
jgi:hypothetical protein